MDAWNFIRRTGHPRTLSRGLMAPDESGPFPRTGLYPFGEISANPNIIQREDNNTLSYFGMRVHKIQLIKKDDYEKYI